MAVYALPAQSLSVVFVADCVLMYCMSSDDLLPLVQGYGVELPVHRPPHLPTGRASTGVGSNQVQLIFVYGVCCNADDVVGCPVDACQQYAWSCTCAAGLSSCISFHCADSIETCVCL